MLKPLDYQQLGIDFLSTRSAALLADEQGLGKTVQAIGAFCKLKAKRILIVCPASLKLNWQKEITTWVHYLTSDTITTHVVGTGKEVLPYLSHSHVIIVNYDLITRPALFEQLQKMHFSVLICDEAHYLKNPKTARTKAILGKKGLIHRAVYKWMLSGTPMTNRPIELWPILKTLAPEVLKPHVSFEAFARRYCNAWMAPWGLDVSGASNLEELSNKLRGKFMLRRWKKQVLKDLPDKRYQFIPIEQTKDMKLKLANVDFDLDSLSKMQLSGENLGEIVTLRRELSDFKLCFCSSLIADALEGGVNKMVIFTYHRSIANKLMQKLAKYNPLKITGDVAVKDRQKAVDRFQNDPNYRVFIGQVQAAGTGITLTAASHVMFLEFSWVPGEVAQAVDRCHRIGQKNSVLVQFPIITDSLEEHMMYRVVEKLKNINEVMA